MGAAVDLAADSDADSVAAGLAADAADGGNHRCICINIFTIYKMGLHAPYIWRNTRLYL